MMSDAATAQASTPPTVIAGVTPAELDSADNANHPPGEDPNWQESSLFCFFDTDTGVAGYHRIGVHPGDGSTRVYSWTTVGGDTVDRRMKVDLPLPDGDTTETQIGGVGIHTVEPLRAWELSVDGERAQMRCRWEGFSAPLTYSLDSGGSKLATGHYNALGRARGTVDVDGRTVEFNGVRYMDHSWGPRDANSILTHQWLLAIFGEDFWLHVMPVGLPRANVMFGYAFKDGTLHHLVEIDTAFAVGYDNRIARSGSATVLDDGGRRFTVTGTAVGDSSLQAFGHGHFLTHRAARFECDGRPGMGLLEMGGPRSIPPSEFASLGLDANHPWLR
jgi:hypothetical protein